MKKKQTTFLEYVAAYLLWLVTLTVSVLVALRLQITISELSDLAGSNRYIAHSIGQFGTILLGLGILTILIVTEHLYRTGVQRGKLLVRFCLWTGILLAIVGLSDLFSLGFRWQSSLAIDPLTPRLAFVEIAGAVILLWWRRIIRLRGESLSEMQ